MEPTNSGIKRSESVRKRPLEQSIYNYGDALPAKVKPGGAIDCAAQFELDQKVHDVEEHFRRSLQSFQQKQSSSIIPVITSSTLKKSSVDHEPHQIVVAENSAAHDESVNDSSTKTQNMHYIINSSKVSSVIAGQTSASTIQPPKVLVNLSGGSSASDSSPTDERIVNTQVLANSNQKNNIFPNIQGLVPSIPSSNWIPVIDNTQFITATPSMTTTTPQLQPTSSPVIVLGPSNIPMLTPSGVVFINPAPDVQRCAMAGTNSLALPSPNHTQNYILLPPPTFSNPVNFGLTLEQITSLTLQRQQHEKIDLTSPGDDHSSVDSNSSMEVHEEIPHSSNVPGADSVEEHFARALGDQWHEVKAGISN